MRPFHWVSALWLLCAVGLGYAAAEGTVSWWWQLLLFSAYMGVMTIGVMRMRWNFFLVHVHRSPVPTKNIALTFDDGPASETAAILDILRAEGVQAAFFTIGDRALGHPDMVRRWDAEGHIVGNHSQHHGHNFDWKTATAMLEEMEEANRTIHSLIGKAPRFFRPPYGITNPAVAKAVKRSGMHSIGWSMRSYDTNYRDAQALLRRTVKLIRGGDVILMHDSMPLTREILTSLIQSARKKGYTFVRLDELLQLDAYA